MLKHLPKAFKNNFVIYKLNVCKISTKQRQLIYSGAPHKISVFKSSIAYILNTSS